MRALQILLTFPAHPTVDELTVLCSALSIPLGALESGGWGVKGDKVACSSHLSTCPTGQTGLRRITALFSTPWFKVFLLASSPAYPTTHSCSPHLRSIQTWHPVSLWAPQLRTRPFLSPQLPCLSLGSLVLSSHFTERGTEVLSKQAGSQGHRQGQRQCQDSDSGVSDSKALNLWVAQRFGLGG